MRAPLQRCLPLQEGQDEDGGSLLEAETPPLDPAQRLWIRGEFDELRPATATEVIAASRWLMTRRVRRGVALDSPSVVRDFLTHKLGALEHEVFAVLLLDLCGAVSYVQMSDPSPEIPKDRPRIDPHKRRLAPPAGYRSDRRRAPAVHVP